MVPKTPDGRVLFAIPRHDHVVVGTTDTPIKTATLEPAALEEEIEFILGTTAKYHAKGPTRGDVLSVFTGVGPTAARELGRDDAWQRQQVHDFATIAAVCMLSRLRRPLTTETTSLGATYLAGLAVGFWQDETELRTHATIDRVFEPRLLPDDVARRRAWWTQAVHRTLNWDNATPNSS